jgi:pyrroline-5-carboxylate reductase
MSITIVGVGNLGTALVQRVLQAGIPAKDVLLVQRGAEGDGDTMQRYGCRMVATIPADIRFSAEDIVIIAVKPQDAEAACHPLRPAMNPDTIVLSVMAGVRVSRLESYLGRCKIVRSMPNLGAAVGESASVFFCGKAVVPSDLERIEKIICAMGRSWQVHDEELVDVATAVAGSGPAYLCFLAEQMESVAQECGFSPEIAHQLILQTFRGTTAYLEEAQLSFAELRSKVTSPAGTTMAALSVLADRMADQAFKDAVRAAFRRAVELGNKS